MTTCSCKCIAHKVLIPCGRAPDFGVDINDAMHILTRLLEPVQTENEIPEEIRDLLAASGVLTSVPWKNEAPITDDAGSYFQTPDSSQSYDWDHATDTLNDVLDVAQAISSRVSQCGHALFAPNSTHCKLLHFILPQLVLLFPNNPCNLLSTLVHFTTPIAMWPSLKVCCTQSGHQALLLIAVC